MSKRVAKLMRIDDNRKFITLSAATKEADRIREKVKREAEQKDYAVQMLIGISDKDVKTQKPKRPHLHTVIFACPGDAVLSMVVSYINDFEKKHGRKSAAKKFNCDINYITYIVEQSRAIRRFEYDPHRALNDLNIIKEATRIRPALFRKRPDRMSANDCQAEHIDTMPQPTCNNRYPHEGACDHRAANSGAQGIPERKKRRGTKTRHQGEAIEYAPLITRDEWLAKSAREKARYYNGLQIPLRIFIWKMRLTEQRLIDDFERHGFVYDKWENKFMTQLQTQIERLNYRKREKEQEKNYIKLDDPDD